MRLIHPLVSEDRVVAASHATMSLKRLSKVSGIPRATLHYRINVMGLSQEKAVDHQKNKWVNYKERRGK